MHGDAQAAVFLAARFRRHSLGDFLLHHDYYIFKREMLFKQLHDDRRRYIVRQVGYDADARAVREAFFPQLPQIRL
ncbi:hypothetical protein D3C85_1837940 [compost metagenome]